MKKIPGGEDDIQEYYRIAPEIVDAVNHRNDAASIWKRIYTELIQKCVALIKDRKYEETYELYKKYTLELSEKMRANVH